MPVTIFLKERKVTLNQETLPVIQLYEQALKEQQLKLKADELGPQTSVSTGEAQTHKGFLATYILTTLEKISQYPLNAKFLTLPAQEIELEVPAELLLRSYVNFLNEMLLEQKLYADSTEQPEIDSKYVLVRELLYRLMGVALSNKLDYQHDGETLLNALRGFIKKIAETEILTEIPLLSSKKASNFLSHLAQKHPKWIGNIEQMVIMVKMVRGNAQAISNTLNRLKQAERIIQMQLIAFINNEQNPNTLTPEWLDLTLDYCEKGLLELQVTEVSTKTLDMRRSFNLTEKQGAILVRLPQDEISEAREHKIAGLYDLLNRTEALYEIMAHLDLLITYSGWMPVLAGVIDFNKLGNLMTNYSQNCAKVLEISPILQGILQTNVGLGLLKYQAATGEELSYTVLQNVKELVQLQDRLLKQRIGRMIGSAVLSLVRLQSRLESNYHFINVERMEQGGWLTLDFQQPAKLPKAPIQQKESSQLLIENYKVKEENKRLLQESQRLSNQTEFTFSVTQLLHINLINQCESKEILNMLKEQGADLKSFCTQQNTFMGYTALHIAASTGNLIACQWLLSQDVSVNIQDNRGETALDKASKRSLSKIIQYLQSQKGESKEIEKCTQTLHYIIDDEDVTEKDESIKPIHIERLSDLIQRGADVNGINTLNNAWAGDRPLHTLLVKGNTRLIHWFMGMGANPNLVDGRRQETPHARLWRVSRNPAPIEKFLETYYSEAFFPSQKQESPVLKFSTQSTDNSIISKPISEIKHVFSQKQ